MNNQTSSNLFEVRKRMSQAKDDTQFLISENLSVLEKDKILLRIKKELSEAINHLDKITKDEK